MSTASPSGGFVVLCESIVYRLASKATWYNQETGMLDPVAFIRHRVKDKEGLSLVLGLVTNCQQASTKLGTVHAVASLHAGRIRSTGYAEYVLDVVQDEPEHGYIAGLPFQHENAAAAERLATKLRDQSRVCWDKKGATK